MLTVFFLKNSFHRASILLFFITKGHPTAEWTTITRRISLRMSGTSASTTSPHLIENRIPDHFGDYFERSWWHAVDDIAGLMPVQGSTTDHDQGRDFILDGQEAFIWPGILATSHDHQISDAHPSDVSFQHVNSCQEALCQITDADSMPQLGDRGETGFTCHPTSLVAHQGPCRNNYHPSIKESNAPRLRTASSTQGEGGNNPISLQALTPILRPTVSTPAIINAAGKRRLIDALFICPYAHCASSFTTKHNLECMSIISHSGNHIYLPTLPLPIDHLRAHKDERPFKCDVCPDSTFRAKGDLVRHMRSQKHASQVQRRA